MGPLNARSSAGTALRCPLPRTDRAHQHLSTSGLAFPRAAALPSTATGPCHVRRPRHGPAPGFRTDPPCPDRLVRDDHLVHCSGRHGADPLR